MTIKAADSIIYLWVYFQNQHFIVSLSLTCVPELFVPVHGQDDEDIAQDVYHDGEDQHAGQRSGHSSGGGAQSAVALIPGQTVRPVHILHL